MLIVISEETICPGAASLVNELFDAGMPVLHLRKPAATASDMQHLIAAIYPKYRALIALHSHHHLAEENGIKRLHFTGKQQAETSAAMLASLKAKGFYLSASMHQLKEIEQQGMYYDHVFFGPVFNSISKKGYSSVLSAHFRLPQSRTKVVALGGIDVHNCAAAFRMGFDGIAVLGAIWQGKDPVLSFLQVKNAYDLAAGCKQ
ncbi:thiamine-phosphate pyrophosphorylase [Cnuella takakiae]|uniref:Thiamine-phosphate pyrophosphorylase n=1 Tax=Cnuella takakiae TaxID=1302690 RepID=A0A1M5IX40_9BACT|nr:thiamine phosphate synthase [Cnuella takakiae]OLY91434.1 hypothetical protein BUE76_05595 [Cnuella takakiae]SHG32685.1 thiamine-phosphate pyrophosphorylase [Cnuella takakiae]